MVELLTQEIGSFRKPTYLSSHFRSLRDDERKKLASKATLETIALYEGSGIMNVGVGGEMFRWEMYEHAASHMKGIEFFGPVRSFDNRYYNKGSVVDKIERTHSLHMDEVNLLKEAKKKNVKIPLTGPYTLMDWSFNDHYEKREDLAMSFGEILNQEIRELKSAWGDETLQIQIDEPAATTHADEMEIVRDSVNESVKDIRGIETHLHVCYSADYGLLYGIIPSLNISVYELEFANRDTISVDGDRPGYHDVKRFKEASETTSRRISLGLGVTDVHVDFLESPALIKSRIEYARKFLDPDYLRLNPDCGLRTRSREIGYEKLKNMALAREQFVDSV